MKKAWIAVAGTILVAAMLLTFFLLGGLFKDPVGFQESDLNAPAVTSIPVDEELPGPSIGVDYPVHLATTLSYTPVYQYYGGVIELFIENMGTNSVYVRSYGLNWEGTGEAYSVNCSKLVSSGEELSMGVLYFAGPGENGTFSFEVAMNFWASSNNGNLWGDKGEVLVGTQEVECLPEPELLDREVDSNPVEYYNKLNELVDFDVVDGLVEEVLSAAPGQYSVWQIIEAYELVRSGISYLAETDDHWQSASETIELGTGDCEDHAILLSSLITALGGDCRINLIEGHAFPTVYVGNSTSDIMDVQENVREYYRNDVPVHWVEDGLGYWLVVDSVGMPYAGGYPAASVPVGDSGGASWNFEDGDWMKTIDVTGETAPGLVL